MNPRSNFYKEMLIINNSLNLELPIKIPKKAFTLLMGEPYSGLTSVAVDIAIELANKKQLVLFLDLGRSITDNRIWDLKEPEFFQRVDVTSDLQIMQVVREFASLEPIIIIDGTLSKDFTTTLDFLVKRIKTISNSTIICTQRKGNTNWNFWTNIIKIEKLNNIYRENSGDSVLIGHFINLGEEKLLIEHTHGRISKGYIEAQKQLTEGRTTNSIFEKDNIKVKGYWNFIEEYDKHSIS
jgi:hypothetical protein